MEAGTRARLPNPRGVVLKPSFILLRLHGTFVLLLTAVLLRPDWTPSWLATVLRWLVSVLRMPDGHDQVLWLFFGVLLVCALGSILGLACAEMERPFEKLLVARGTATCGVVANSEWVTNGDGGRHHNVTVAYDTTAGHRMALYREDKNWHLGDRLTVLYFARRARTSKAIQRVLLRSCPAHGQSQKRYKWFVDFGMDVALESEEFLKANNLCEWPLGKSS